MTGKLVLHLIWVTSWTGGNQAMVQTAGLEDACVFTRALPIRVSRDMEMMLEEGIFLLNGLHGMSGDEEILYAPSCDVIIPLTKAQAALLRANVDNTTRLSRLLDGLLGKDRHERTVQTDEDRHYLPVSVALMMTTACQLRCTYCYAEAGFTPKEFLSEQVAHAAISQVVKNVLAQNRRSFTVHFHGAGEPTLAWRTIRSSLSLARSLADEHSLALRTVITTNLCIPEERASLLGREMDTLLVSCDGPPDIMRKNRPMLKNDSGAVIERALRRVVADGYAHKVWVRATVTTESQSRLSEFVEYFHSLGLINLYLVPVANSGRGKDLSCVDVDAYLHSWVLAKETAHRLGVNLESPVADPDHIHTNGFSCGINGANFAVLPNGKVSLCYEAVLEGSEQARQFHIGQYHSGKQTFLIDLKEIKRVKDTFHVRNRSACDTCFCRPTCAGHCSAREMNPVGNPRDVPMGEACDIIRSITAMEVVRRATEETRGDQDESR